MKNQPAFEDSVEASLTAMLLGELSPEQEAKLRAAVLSDPALEKTRARLAATIDLAKGATRGGKPGTTAAPMQLSNERRQKLLAAFKTCRPSELGIQAQKRRIWTRSDLTKIAAMLAALCALSASLLSSFRSTFTPTRVDPLGDTTGLVRQLAEAPVTASRPVTITVEGVTNISNFSRPAAIDAVEGKAILGGVADASEKAKKSGALARLGRGETRALPTEATQEAARTGERSASDDLKPTPLSRGGMLEPRMAARYGLVPAVPQSEAKMDSGASSQREGLMPYYPQNDFSRPTVVAAESARSREREQLAVPASPRVTPLATIMNAPKPAPSERADASGTEAGRSPATPALGLASQALEKMPAKEQSDSFFSKDRSSLSAGVKLHSTVTGQAVPGRRAEQQAVVGLSLDAETRLQESAQNLWEASARDKEVLARGVELRKAEVDAQPSARVTGGAEETTAEENALKRAPQPAWEPQPEVSAAEQPFSTFSLNVSDVSFKLAQSALENGVMPDPSSIRSEEFINALDYRDPEPAAGTPLAFRSERARYPYAHNREVYRFSLKTGSTGRQADRPLNLVLLIDNSGSMERADRARIRQQCLEILAGQLKPQDKVSVIAFARTARMVVDGLPGNQAREMVQSVATLVPQGGTNLEEGLEQAYRAARAGYLVGGVNRVVLITDGAANLGDANPVSLKQKVEAQRKGGIALDCFGIGWDGLDDHLLETLARNGDGRYGFVNTPEAASQDFAAQLAGALQVAASDVKVQVEFNPARVAAYRQVGYARHQLTQEQFRDNTVDAAELGAAEAGNALYIVEIRPQGEGPVATVRARFKVPGTENYREHSWTVPYQPGAPRIEDSSATLRLAVAASALSEWLAQSPHASEVTPDAWLAQFSGLPEQFSNAPRVRELEWMMRQAKSVSGK